MTRILAILIAVGLTACSSSAPAQTDGRIQAVATTGQVADLVRNVGGESVSVITLMGEGVDPHLYRASQGDVARLTNAEMIFYNGLMLEGRLAEVLSRVARGGKIAVAIAEEIDESLLLEPSGIDYHYDPHIWMDVDLWARAIPIVVERLAALRPELRAEFEANGEAYRQRLMELRKWVEDEIASIPEEGRVLVTAHDAFGYFGRAYDIDVVGLQGISTASEFGLQDIERLIELIAERGVKAVFVEASVPPRSIQALVEGCRAKGHEVRIGGELFSDSMGAPNTPEGAYIGMIEHNVRAIVDALK